MRTNRCPWCAKQIDKTKNRYQAFRTTPGSRFTRFERCQYCQHFYGQPLAAKWIVLYVVLALTGIILLSTLWQYVFLALTNMAWFSTFWQKTVYHAALLLAVGTVLWICSRPFQRMDEHENLIPFDMPILKMTFAVSFQPKKTIKKNTLYFLSDDLDKQDSYCAVSPILVHAFEPKTGELTFSFLYDHPLNQQYIRQERIALYDSDMHLTAELLNAT